MSNSSLTPLQRQIYWSAPSPVIERGRRRTAFGLLLILGVERLLREGRLRGDQARLAMGQAQAARLLSAPVTGAAWKTRRGDVLRMDGDELAAALVLNVTGGDPEFSPGASLIGDWLADGQLSGAAAPSAIDRLRVAQVLLREHRFDGEERDDLPPPSRLDLVVEEQSSSAPNAWQDD